MKCRTCEEPNADNGEGWDGECGDCADRSFAKEEQVGGKHESGLDRTYCAECFGTLEEGQSGLCDECQEE